MYNVFHNYMFRPILGHLQRREDGLKWAETCSCEIHCTYCAQNCAVFRL